jgi:HEPN domain-containing protein
MERFYPTLLIDALSAIHASSHSILVATAGVDNPTVDTKVLDNLQQDLSRARKECVDVALSPAVLSNIDNCISVLTSVPDAHSTLPNMLLMTENAIRSELEVRLFMFIPPEDANWYEQAARFGPSVAAAFPSSADDIREAGNCYAMGRYTAAVYHAICALEPALRALSHNVKVKWKPNQTTWAAAIREIEDAVKALATGKGARRIAQRLAFLSQATTHFRYFKDAWRNDAAHARLKVAEKADAERMLNHARSFMELLSSRLHERGVAVPSPSAAGSS